MVGFRPAGGCPKKPASDTAGFPSFAVSQNNAGAMCECLGPYSRKPLPPAPTNRVKKMITAIDTIIMEQQQRVADSMEKFGGSFIQNLGRALRHADLENLRKIYQNWTDEWLVYLNFAKATTGGNQNDQE